MSLPVSQLLPKMLLVDFLLLVINHQKREKRVLIRGSLQEWKGNKTKTKNIGFRELNDGCRDFDLKHFRGHPNRGSSLGCYILVILSRNE